MINEGDKVSILPDNAIYYVASSLMKEKMKDGMLVVNGIATNDIRSILELFLTWCKDNGQIEDGKLIIFLE